MDKQELRKVQDDLDFKKYILSESAGMDLSGKLSSCFNCQFRDEYRDTCVIEHEARVRNSTCALQFMAQRGYSEKEDTNKSHTKNNSKRKRNTKNK